MAVSVGKPVRGSTSGRPIMALLDVLGQRWTLRILWELRDGRQSFRALQERCDSMSPTILNQRLKALRGMNLVELDEAGFGLTARAQQLSVLLLDLDRLANDWAALPDDQL